MPYTRREDTRSTPRGGSGKRFGSSTPPWKRDAGGSGKSFDRPMLHPATCASCGNRCEVPFKPNGRKPIYCSNCFTKDGDSAPKRSYGDRPESSSSFGAKRSYGASSYGKDSGAGATSAVEGRLKAIEMKLDAILEALGND